MINSSRSLLFTLLLGSTLCALAAGAALPKQLQQIESLILRADKMAFGVPGANNYHLAKARTWLDLALSEYHENEGNGIVPAAIEQADILLNALEIKQADISMYTPKQLPGSEAVRPDLWDKIEALKKHDKFSCGQRAVAEAEVHLVWAGHEKLESSWADAQSYANSAEDLIREAQNSINECVNKIPVTVTNIPATEKIILFSDALFDFNKATLEPPVQWRLNRVTDSIKMAHMLEAVILIGHTDRLRSDGHHERNQLLSEQRAESIKRYLVEKGVPSDKIHTSGAGSSQPLVVCSTKPSKAQQVKCLQPNRRVEIILRQENQELDTANPANPAPAIRN
jgi:OmpA-OmpF porin, OOP family